MALTKIKTGSVSDSITLTTPDINGGTIDATLIGGTTPAAVSGTTGQFGTSLNVDGTATVDALTVDGASGTATIALNDSRSNVNDTAVIDFRHKGITGSQIKSTAIEDFSTSANRSSDLSFHVRNNGTIIDAAYIDSSGNVGINVAAPDGTLHVHTATAGTVTASPQADDLVVESNTEAGMTIITPDNQSARIRFTSPSTNTDVGGAFIFYRQNINKMQIGTSVAGGVLSLASGAGNEAINIDASGNVGFGVTPDAPMHVYKNSGLNTTVELLRLDCGDTTHQGGKGGKIVFTDISVYNPTAEIIAARVGVTSTSTLAFSLRGSEVMRCVSGGDVGIGLINGNHRFQVLNNKGNFACAKFESNSAASQEYGLAVVLANDPNGTTRYIFAGIGGSTVRFIIYANGNVKNQNNSYTGISDEKLKENISDATSQWEDIKAIRVRKYSFKEENATSATQIGVIAQEVVAAGMSGLVYETPDQVTAEDGTIENTGEVTKNMKYSILYMKAIKALQEAQTRVESLETLTESLTARITALEGA